MAAILSGLRGIKNAVRSIQQHGFLLCVCHGGTSAEQSLPQKLLFQNEQTERKMPRWQRNVPNKVEACAELSVFTGAPLNLLHRELKHKLKVPFTRTIFKHGHSNMCGIANWLTLFKRSRLWAPEEPSRLGCVPWAAPKHADCGCPHVGA